MACFLHVWGSLSSTSTSYFSDANSIRMPIQFHLYARSGSDEKEEESQLINSGKTSLSSSLFNDLIIYKASYHLIMIGLGVG